jgi:hypothetical protein
MFSHVYCKKTDFSVVVDVYRNGDTQSLFDAEFVGCSAEKSDVKAAAATA